jgi:hypothetical protein
MRELGLGICVDDTTCVSGRTLIGATSAIGTGPSCDENEANAAALLSSSVTLPGASSGRLEASRATILEKVIFSQTGDSEAAILDPRLWGFESTPETSANNVTSAGNETSINRWLLCG